MPSQSISAPCEVAYRTSTLRCNEDDAGTEHHPVSDPHASGDKNIRCADWMLSDVRYLWPMECPPQK